MSYDFSYQLIHAIPRAIQWIGIQVQSEYLYNHHDLFFKHNIAYYYLLELCLH